MAQDGDTGSSTSQIAERLGVKVTALGPARAQLINKGIIYSPEYGRVAFTVQGWPASSSGSTRTELPGNIRGKECHVASLG
jgi:hypothetical protein